MIDLKTKLKFYKKIKVAKNSCTGCVFSAGMCLLMIDSDLYPSVIGCTDTVHQNYHIFTKKSIKELLLPL